VGTTSVSSSLYGESSVSSLILHLRHRCTRQSIHGKGFRQRPAVRFPSIFDPAMRSLIALGNGYPTSVVPTTLVLDGTHRVAAVFLRALLAEDLQPVVERVAAEQ
jgi:hypothetical protein